MRYAARTDHTQTQIVAGLRAVGFDVTVVKKPADLAIRREGWWPGTFLFLDCKPATYKRPRKDQAEQTAYFEQHGIPVATSALEAIDLAWRVNGVMNYVVQTKDFGTK